MLKLDVRVNISEGGTTTIVVKTWRQCRNSNVAYYNVATATANNASINCVMDKISTP